MTPGSRTRAGPGAAGAFSEPLHPMRSGVALPFSRRPGAGLPLPPASVTRCFERRRAAALPVSAAVWPWASSPLSELPFPTCAGSSLLEVLPGVLVWSSRAKLPQVPLKKVPHSAWLSRWPPWSPSHCLLCLQPHRPPFTEHPGLVELPVGCGMFGAHSIHLGLGWGFPGATEPQYAPADGTPAVLAAVGWGERPSKARQGATNVPWAELGTFNF